MPSRNVWLSPLGADQWIPATLVFIPVITACIALVSHGESGWWIPGILSFMVWLGFVLFFRDPKRIPPRAHDGCMMSPADGRISAITHLSHHESVNGPATVIRIFLSVLDVHINRVPWDGHVMSQVHRPGRYLDVRNPLSAQVNESMLLSLRAADGRLFGIRQVSGAIARRIVCLPRVGDRVIRGDRLGMIKFGSTTELILAEADAAHILVRQGDRVVGGITPLARFAH